MPVNMTTEEKDPVFVMNSLSDQRHRDPHLLLAGGHEERQHYLSTESLEEDHASTTSSLESNNPNHPDN